MQEALIGKDRYPQTDNLQPRSNGTFSIQLPLSNFNYFSISLEGLIHIQPAMILGLRKRRLGLMLGLAVVLCGMLDGSGRAGVGGVNAEEYSEWDSIVRDGEQEVLNGGMGEGKKESFGSADVGKGWTLGEINEELQVWLIPHTPIHFYLHRSYWHAIISSADPQILLGMSYCSNPQRPTIYYLPVKLLRGTLHLDPNPFRIPLPLWPCRQLPPRNSLHLRPPQLHPRARAPRHRSLPPLHHGCIRNRWIAR